jgi:hypothetical protein
MLHQFTEKKLRRREATRPDGKYIIAKPHFAERVAIEPEQRGSNWGV